jgi:hypothetical protein
MVKVSKGIRMMLNPETLSISRDSEKSPERPVSVSKRLSGTAVSENIADVYCKVDWTKEEVDGVEMRKALSFQRAQESYRILRSRATRGFQSNSWR